MVENKSTTQQTLCALLSLLQDFTEDSYLMDKLMMYLMMYLSQRTFSKKPPYLWTCFLFR